ncbi:DUF5914 domain-containing protein [Streptomyces cacaoi]|uniref:DUF5914 domain-containing protein n=1 Tax=Streptomyces cacaoi TaxID=1898 RepID=UPI0037498E8D
MTRRDFGLGGRLPLRWRPARAWEQQRPTWREARPGLIAAALRRARARPAGNWFVVGAHRELAAGRPLGARPAGREVVVWRNPDGRLVAGPGVCPHLGAPLAESPVCRGRLVCRWHGLALDGRAFAGWQPLPVHDDGALVWVRLDDVGGQEPLAAPVVPQRPDPSASVCAVYRGTGVCDPEDVVANRLDPWHGAWFHPYSFVDLTVVAAPPERLPGDGAGAGGGDSRGADRGGGTGGAGAGDEEGEDCFVVDVSFRAGKRLVVPVRARFTAPGPRTVVMRITHGEGRGSVVETHATPLGPGADGRPRTAVFEAVVATSDRPGFAVARGAAPLLRPLMRATAARLWRDDLAYAERRSRLRATGTFPG